jgi:hypothetical protein
MSANEKDLEIEDDLAKGTDYSHRRSPSTPANVPPSPENTSGPEVQDLLTIEEEFRSGEGRQISRLSYCVIDSESDGPGRGL